MEKIKVNMSPNPLDVQTIHASQNDGEARQWEFELHNNGDVIDSSEVTDQIVFKAYKGGTEQILPENGSTPTTSPFLGDIKYPQGLLSDQEFLYRESPTEEDGLAKITDIKGNTLVWNQLQQSASASQTINGIAYTVNNDGSITANGTATATSIFYLPQIGQLYANHKYLVKGCPSGGTAQTYMLTFRCNGFSTVLTNEVGNGAIANWQNYNDGQMGIRIASGVTLSNAKFYPQVFDLTQMGLDISSPSEFTSLFPLSYYSYNQGTLLSFNGNGIKTVGKNRSQLVSMSTISGGFINASSGDIATVKKGMTYTLSFDNLTTSTANIVARILANGTWIRQGENNLVANSRWTLTFTATDDGVLGLSAGLGSQYSQVKVFDNIQLEFGSTATSYEPYESHTTNLPISTYFPTGMKSAGTVYDELTPTKAITRIGAVDMGSLTWQYLGNNAFLTTVDGLKPPASNGDAMNAKTGKYNVVSYNTLSGDASLNCLSGYVSTNRVYVRDTSFTDVSAFTSAMNGVYLYYELATPTETSFTTASLVTENAEIPLSNEDGVLIGKCTEQLSSESGFFDAKIKLADEDGECYSNKIQLHVERSPQ